MKRRVAARLFEQKENGEGASGDRVCLSIHHPQFLFPVTQRKRNRSEPLTHNSASMDELEAGQRSKSRHWQAHFEEVGRGKRPGYIPERHILEANRLQKEQVKVIQGKPHHAL